MIVGETSVRTTSFYWFISHDFICIIIYLVKIAFCWI